MTLTLTCGVSRAHLGMYVCHFVYSMSKLLLSSTKDGSRSHPTINRAKSVVGWSDDDDAMSVKSTARCDHVFAPLSICLTDLMLSTSNRPLPRRAAKSKPVKTDIDVYVISCGSYICFRLIFLCVALRYPLTATTTPKASKAPKAPKGIWSLCCRCPSSLFCVISVQCQ